MGIDQHWPAILPGVIIASVVQLMVLGFKLWHRWYCQRLLDPDFIPAAERDIYFNREYARPEAGGDVREGHLRAERSEPGPMA